MIKYNTIHNDYTNLGDNYQFKLPLNIDYIIPKDDSVRLLSHIVEEMNLEELYKTYSRIRGNSITPRKLLKILIYANMNSCYSSRKIEELCKRDINFMYLLDGAPAPDHATIARFRSIHYEAVCENLMAQFTKLLGYNQEISKEAIFIDGTKIEANANRYTFVWKKTITKNMDKMSKKISDLVLKCERDFNIKVIYKNQIKLYHLKKLLKKLKKLADEEAIIFVQGKGKRKSPLQKVFEELKGYIDRLKNYTKNLHILGERNSFSKTDNDATFMRMKEDHMKNGQLKPAYNIQFGVDSGYIVWATCGPQPTDTTTLIPFLTSFEKNIGFKYQKVVADAGYESEENYMFLENNEQLSFIKTSNYEKSKTRKYKNDIGKVENMTYYEDDDYYICKNNQKLCVSSIKPRETKTGYKSEVTYYTCEDCSNCEYKSNCINEKTSKKPIEERTKNLYVSKLFKEKRKENLERITSPEGRKLRMNRSIQAEGAFAQIKHNMNYKRFLSRGKSNVLAETILVAIAHNINKLHSKLINHKSGQYFYELKQ